MAVVLGINAVFHDPAAALVIDGRIVAAAEEERFSRRKHGKNPVPFSAWELPAEAIKWCLTEAGIDASQIDAVGYSYDPDMCEDIGADITANNWEGLLTLYAQRAPLFLQTVLPGIRKDIFHHVRHHIAHGASSYLAAPWKDSAVLVLDGRGEKHAHLAGHCRGGNLKVLTAQPLPASLGLVYEELTAHLGFRRSSDEYKVMAMASYGEPRFINDFRRLIHTTGDGGFVTDSVDWSSYAKALSKGDAWQPEHADLAATVQLRTEEIILELATWLHEQTHEQTITMAGGVALNCVANGRLVKEGPFENVWVQPAAGDGGTALGSALYVAHQLGDSIEPMTTAALGPHWSDDELEATLKDAAIIYERPTNIADAAAEVLAADGVVAWFQGRSEYGPRALGHRSLLANPSKQETLEKMNNIKGREQFRPVAPMVTEEQFDEIFEGQFPSPYMLFTHSVKDEWRERIPAAVHVDGSARVQTVSRDEEPLVHRMIESFAQKTGLPVVINTSLNTSGRPMVDDPQDALECFGSAPVDALAIGPFLVRRSAAFGWNQR